jgi:hypothetical protein
VSKLTEKQLREQAEALGIGDGQWDEMGGGEPKSPAFANRIAENLKKMNELLEQAVEGKQGEVRLLQEKLARLKHGGGS